ncbi:hypothetical protein KC362_g68 [Hortaea werneckii]|nr:hypothetical protein KC362_g68 [Hortaea werneckii]
MYWKSGWGRPCMEGQGGDLLQTCTPLAQPSIPTTVPRSSHSSALGRKTSNATKSKSVSKAGIPKARHVLVFAGGFDERVELGELCFPVWFRGLLRFRSRRSGITCCGWWTSEGVEEGPFRFFEWVSNAGRLLRCCRVFFYRGEKRGEELSRVVDKAAIESGRGDFDGYRPLAVFFESEARGVEDDLGVVMMGRLCPFLFRVAPA